MLQVSASFLWVSNYPDMLQVSASSLWVSNYPDMLQVSASPPNTVLESPIGYTRPSECSGHVHSSSEAELARHVQQEPVHASQLIQS